MKDNPEIEKCLFVVDRKDLDRQTREEFNRFQEGCVEANTNTGALVTRMASDDYADKVIVTTIQKLGLALDGNNSQTYQERLEGLRNKRVVFIFDECHRSQFGENHQAIRDFFPKAQLCGFTGTPIFEKNATYQQVQGEQGRYRTTDDLFQRCLHQYTITHAIDDQNVLKFRVDYRCNACKEDFTVRTGTIFERSHVPLHKWIYAMYLLVTSRKGISSMQLAKEIGVTQKSAWFVLQRLREACGNDTTLLSGIVEIDEAYFGGKEKNRHENGVPGLKCTSG